MRSTLGGRVLCRMLMAIAIAAAATGCTSLRRWARQGFRVGPDYTPPAAPVADHWIDYRREDFSTAPGDHPEWWRVFGDPQLTELIRQASTENLTLRAAGMRILEARARLGVARGYLLPQLQDAFGAVTRDNTSRTTANVLPVPNFTTWDASFNLSWELDFWGRFRRAVEQHRAILDARIEDYDNVLVLLQAQVASAYIEYRTFQRRLEFARQNVALQERTLQIADVQFRNGKVTELDVAQAKENLARTRATIPALESGMRQAANALCVLLAIPPRDLTETLGKRPIPEPPAQVVVGVPADLLRRRPDVRRAERLAAAQSAVIGIAESEFYPHIAIGGSLGYSSATLRTLFQAASFQGFVGPSFRWNILHYGRILNTVRAEQALFYERVIQYQQTVLEAAREVEDAMVAFVKRREQVEQLRESTRQAERSVEISTTQYRRGRVNFQPVVYMQQILASRQDDLASAQGDIALQLVALYKALGGGWQARFVSGGTPAPEPPRP